MDLIELCRGYAVTSGSYDCVTLQLIGTPSEAELGFLNENAKRYIRQLPLYRRQSFTEKFPRVHPLAIDLVEKMLTFDPRLRITGANMFFDTFL